MSLKLYEENSVKAIADVVREKLSTTNTYTIGELATAISAIQPGGQQPQLHEVSISIEQNYLNIDNPTTNGDFVASYDVYKDNSLWFNTTETYVNLGEYTETEGTYTIYVVANGDNFESSLKSNEVSWINQYSCLKLTATGSVDVYLEITLVLAKSIDAYYRKNGSSGTWTSWLSGTHGTSSVVSLANGETLEIYNKNTTWSGQTEGSSPYITIKSSSSTGGTFVVSGNIMSLENFDTSLKGNDFTTLFYKNEQITDASSLSLPLTTLASGCYGSMFEGCVNLVSMPNLPATKLASLCYTGMFSGCTSLTTLGTFYGKYFADYCCSTMFKDCTSLVNASKWSLPVQIDLSTASSCFYQMFLGCTALTVPMQIKPTYWVNNKIANSVFNAMFSGCTSLNVSGARTITLSLPFINIPSTITVGKYTFNGMFKNCVLSNEAVETPTGLPLIYYGKIG